MEHLDARHIPAKSLPDPLLDAILAHSAEGIVVLDTSGRVQECNAVAARLCGRSPRDLIGRDWTSPGLDEPAREASPGPGDSERGLARSATETGASPTQPIETRHVLRNADGRAVATLVFLREAGSGETNHTARTREHALSEALRALRTSHEQLKNAQLQLIQAAKLE